MKPDSHNQIKDLYAKRPISKSRVVRLHTSAVEPKVVDEGSSVKSKDWAQVIDRDGPRKAVTTEVVQSAQRERKLVRGCVRLSTGKIWTDKEYEKHRKKILKTPLP